MLHTIKKKAGLHLVNSRGWRTDRKIIVFESDDWGSIRMPSSSVYEKLQQSGVPVEKSAYCRYDSLESDKDLELLFDALTKTKDSVGNYPVITANTVVANPDFEKIKASAFTRYFFEPFTNTLDRYPRSSKVYKYYIEGIENGIFIPQFHGREHVNVPYWLNLLKTETPFQKAFDEEMWGLSTDIYPHLVGSIQATYDCDLETARKSITQGLQLFENLFGYKSKSFIPNNFILSEELFDTSKSSGVEHFQGMKYQLLPLEAKASKRKKIRRFTGQKNKYRQTFGVRNCSFELTEGKSTIASCLKEIANAFWWKKPAIISVHRLNFIGRLDEDNRDKNLQKFQSLLKKIVTYWPEVEFISTPALAEAIVKEESFWSI